MTLIGDSSVRQLIEELTREFPTYDPYSEPDPEVEHDLYRFGFPKRLELGPAQKHSNISYQSGQGSFEFIWDPYLNSTSLAALRDTRLLSAQQNSVLPEPRSPKYAVVGGGLWHARHINSAENDSRSAFAADVGDLINSRLGLHDTQMVPVFLPLTQPYYPWLNPDRGSSMTPTRIRTLNNDLARLSEEHDFDVVWASMSLTDTSAAFEDDGLHTTPRISRTLLEILTTRLCPRIQDYTCCSKSADIVHGQVLAIFAAIMAIGGSLLHKTPTARAIAVFATAILYCFFADRTMLFERVNKLVDVRLFVLSCVGALIAGILTLGRCPEGDILSRQQTQEWKGWMQIVILLYHYFGMSQVESVYRLIRVLVASYIFLTGFGHASYFIHTKDFSFRRVATVLLRLNLLSVTLPFTMDTTYQFYYFPMLASIWFVITWATMSTNLGKDTGVRLVCSAILVKLLYGKADVILRALSNFGMVSIEGTDFRYRFGLDLYATYLGMAAAILLATSPDLVHAGGRRVGMSACITGIIACSIYWMLTSGMRRSVYNELHRYWSLLPIIGYVVLRNAIPSWRNRYSRLFAWFGRHSLETFVLQYHIWLAADTHGVLHLGLIDRYYNEPSTRGSWRFWTEVFLITACFLWVCAGVTKASAAIVKAVVHKSEGTDEKSGGLVMFETVKCPELERITWAPLQWLKLSDDARLRWKCFIIVMCLWALNVCWPWKASGV